MKAAFKTGSETVVRDISTDKLGATDIRVKVSACGVCGTDLHVNPDEADQESRFGHEIAGEIIEVGSAAGYLEVGQKVVLDSATPCGRCDSCRDGRQELCTDVQSFFFLGSFGFAEEMIAPAICAIPCEDIAPDIANIQEPLGVAIDLVRLADIKPGSNVLITGQGPIGLMATAMVKRMGARRVFASEFAAKTRRVELARQFGADDVIDPAVTPIADYDFGCRIDRILVTSPPATLAGAFDVACKGAIVSFIGIAHGDGAFCTFNANDFHFKKLQLRASFASPAMFGPTALRYLREGVIDGEAIVTHRFGLDDIAKALEVARNDPSAVKVVVTP